MFKIKCLLGGVEDENPEDYTKNKKLFPIIFPIAIEQKN